MGGPISVEPTSRATIAMAVPAFARFWKMDNVLFLVAGPGDVFLAWSERRTDGMHAGHDARAFVNFIEDPLADASHDAHIHNDVGRVRELYTDFCHGRPDGTHAEGQDVHSAALHCAVEEALELAAHVVGIFPIVGGAGGVLGIGADEGAIFDAGYIIGIGTGIKAAGPEFLVEPDESAIGDHFLAQVVVFFLGAVDPVDARGVREFGHFLDPAKEVVVLA